MGNVSPEKVITSPGTGDGKPPASEPNMSQSDSAPDVTNSKYAQSGYSGHPSTSAYPAPGRYGPPSPLNMSNMVYSLPNHQSPSSPFEGQHLIHQYPPTHPQGLGYPIQSMGPYAGPNSAGSGPYAVPFAPGYAPYSMQHPGTVQHIPGHYPQYMANPSMQNMGPGQPPTYGAGYYQQGYIPPSRHGSQSGPGQMRHSGSQSRQSSLSQGHSVSNQGSTNKATDKQASKEEYDVSKTIVDGSNPMKLAQLSSIPHDSTLPSQSVATAPNPPRGPPRKPKQSGHALWVGNLPPGASVVDLKDHFSQEATNDIESVFLISKSNCAFVNYKSAAVCAVALVRFHDSRFQGVRLVCRLRKGFTAPGSGVGVGVAGPGSRPRPEEKTDPRPTAEAGSLAETTIPRPLVDGAVSRSLDRYFIVKSLTVEDLELSKQSGIWATQTHNETNLNHAFEHTDHVYLIFSANKSGEYFGYARMLSPISDDEELALEMPPRPEPLPGTADELEVTTTAATSTAPKGRIIDDSARGTIFWEVDSSEDEHDDGSGEKSGEASGSVAGPGPPPSVSGPIITVDDEEAQSFGKPFRIQWLSTERVPFHRTRGLRNPWNANREVKIARDGTEIEPTIGRKLIALFHLP
ncbi:YT521-B-like splicing factor [Penicillium brasilianum]|uniref:YT521-B-like splicing factor n=1 Tax=Penicillium brasilianum TaxID=104259 RepID=A0A1S9RP63_PENBI|nr:YT521-B-like splicing factor [Penicillium brasilianum]